MRLLVLVLPMLVIAIFVVGSYSVLQHSKRRQLTSTSSPNCEHRNLDPVTTGSDQNVSYLCRDCDGVVYDLKWIRKNLREGST